MSLLDALGRPIHKHATTAPAEERPLNRAERRAMRNDIRAYRKAAARQRDKDYGERGLESPALPISEALRNRGLGHRWLRGDRWLAKLPTRGQRRRRATLNRRRRQAKLLP